jgi:hypothetical protein
MNVPCSSTEAEPDHSEDPHPYHVTLAYSDLCSRFEFASDVAVTQCFCCGATTPHWLVVVSPKPALVLASNVQCVHRAVVAVPLVQEGVAQTELMRDTLRTVHKCMSSRSAGICSSLSCSQIQWKTFVAFVDLVGNVSYYACADASTRAVHE